MQLQSWGRGVPGNTSRSDNPTKYRDPSFYHELLQRVSTSDDDGLHVFEVIMCKSLQTYIKVITLQQLQVTSTAQRFLT